MCHAPQLCYLKITIFIVNSDLSLWHIWATWYQSYRVQRSVLGSKVWYDLWKRNLAFQCLSCSWQRVHFYDWSWNAKVHPVREASRPIQRGVSHCPPVQAWAPKQPLLLPHGQWSQRPQPTIQRCCQGMCGGASVQCFGVRGDELSNTIDTMLWN